MTALPVLVRHRPVWLLAAGMSSRNVPWREGLTLGDVVHRDRAGLWCAVNGQPDQDLARALAPGDIVDEGTRPNGPVGAAISFYASWFAVAAASILFSLIGKPKPPKDRKDDKSTQYGWSGLHNNRVEGQPRGPIYGQLRVAPQVLDEFVVNRNAQNESDLLALLGFGEGPITAIGDKTADNDPAAPFQSDNPTNPLPTGIQVNGNNLANLDGIEAHVRLGTNEQAAVPGFELVNTNYDVGITLTQLETTLPSNAGLNPNLDLLTVAYNSDGIDAQAVWDTYGASFDLTAPADEYGVVIEFPSGLYSISGSGSVSDAYFQVLIRYMELDGGGSPITSGGDNADGWVYEPPDVALVSRNQQSFAHEFQGSFRDPQLFVPQLPGRALDCMGASQFAATSATPSLPASFAAGQQITALTFVGWVRFNDLAGGTNLAHRPFIEQSSTGPGRGFAFGLQRINIDSGGSGPTWAWVPVVYINLNSVSIHAPGSQALANSASTTPWYHFALTYTLNNGSGLVRYRMFVNGVQVHSVLSSLAQYKIVSSGNAIELLRSVRLFNGSTVYCPALGDEFVLDNREWTPTEIAVDYAVGHGRMNASSSTLVAGWHFDDTSPADDFSPRGNSATVTGGTSGVTGGHVLTGQSGALKRSKYRVQVLRLNLKSTSQRIQDESVWSLLYGKLDDQLAYPNTPVLGLKIKATEQLNGSSPDYTVLVKGRAVPIWDGSAIVFAWSQNPAWIALDVITNRRYGAGSDFDFDDVDLTAWKEWADYCGELIFDGRQYNRQAIDEGGTTSDVYDLTYDSTLFGGYGGIKINFRVSPTLKVPPTYWTVGRHLGFTGIPAPSGAYTVDINTSNIPGFEIGAVEFNIGWIITVKFDRATYGNPWTDGQDLSTVLAAPLTGVLEGREPRFQCNYNPDTFSNVWDTLIRICQTARAMPLLIGGRVTVRCERPRSTVALVGMASIVEGSFKTEYTDKLDLPNSYSCDFLDEDGNYARSTASYDDPELDAITSTDDLRRESLELDGVTRRSQVMRHLAYMLAVNRLLTQSIEFRSGLEQLALEVGDVFAVSHDIVPWGKSGRIATGSSTTSIVLDRDITLAAATTYYLRVRHNAAGQTGSGTSVSDAIETVQVTSGSGSYPAGTPITVNAFGSAPAKDDLYVLFKASEEFLAQVTEISLTETMEHTVKAVRYDAATYDIDVLPGDLPDNMITTGDAPLGPATIPQHPTPAEVRELVRRTSDGAWRSTFLVSWTNASATARVLARTSVYARLVENGPWQKLGSAEGAGQTFEWEPEHSVPGDSYEFALQPESTGGARQRPSACARVRGLCLGISVPPDPPLSFTATMDLDRAVYTIVPPANARGLSFEIRRGGWLLGQPVAVIQPGQTSVATENWASGAANALGEKQPPLLVRSRDSRGQYSEAVRLTSFDPSAQSAQPALYPTYLPNEVFADQSWEDYGTGWVGGVYTGPTLTGLQVSTIGGRKVLEFSGGNLTGTYETAYVSFGAIAQSVPAERYYVEAFLVADQVPPLLVSDWTLALDDPLAGRRSVEGALVTLPGEPANCTAVIEWRWSVAGGSFTDWVRFKPGVQYFQQPQFRVVFTRPDSTYQVRAFRFHTRISRIVAQRRELSPLQKAGLNRFEFAGV